MLFLVLCDIRRHILGKGQHVTFPGTTVLPNFSREDDVCSTETSLSSYQIIFIRVFLFQTSKFEAYDACNCYSQTVSKSQKIIFSPAQANLWFCSIIIVYFPHTTTIFVGVTGLLLLKYKYSNTTLFNTKMHVPTKSRF